MSFEPPCTSPFWQKPGRYWELIPEVPYASYEEYVTLTEAASQEYSALIKDSMTLEVEAGKDNIVNQTLNLAYIGLPFEVRHIWADKGKDIFLKLTKGVGIEWCELVNTFILCMLDATARTYIQSKLMCPVQGFDEAVADVCIYLQRQAHLFIKDRNLNPMGYYSFYFVNFKYYRSSLDLDYCLDHNMPMAQFKQIMAAFAMGGHARLGESSCINVLQDELMRLVFRFEIFD